MPEEWELYEKHATEVNTILKEDGCMDLNGHIRAWHGLKTDKKLEDAGHDSLDFKKCKCRGKKENHVRQMSM